MNNFRLLVFATIANLSTAAVAADWPQWRGPTRNGIAPAGPEPPLEWSETKNVLWSSPVPGRGHGSPTVYGDHIFLPTAEQDSGTQSIVAYNRATGRQIWQQTIHEVKKWPKIHTKNTHASSTIACDGRRLFVTFYNGAEIYLTATDLNGKISWQKMLAKFEPKYPFGYAASPLLVGDEVIATAESQAETALVALDRRTGEEVWRTPRPQNSSYSSPILLTVGGREQLLMTGNLEIRAYDPASGADLWNATGAAQHTCGTVTGEGDLVVASGGYPESETFCVRADGSSEVLWRNPQKCYEQSLLIHNGYVYAVTDGGVAYCWNAESGAEQWKKRLGGPVSASPVLIGDRIYATNEKGTTFVFAADPTTYVPLTENQLGTDAFPTPVFLDGRIYARVGILEGDSRRELLYCLKSEQ